MLGLSPSPGSLIRIEFVRIMGKGRHPSKPDYQRPSNVKAEEGCAHSRYRSEFTLCISRGLPKVSLQGPCIKDDSQVLNHGGFRVLKIILSQQGIFCIQARVGFLMSVRDTREATEMPLLELSENVIRTRQLHEVIFPNKIH